MLGEFMPPDAVQALLDQVRGQVDRLNNDIQASNATKVGTFRDNWHSFVEEFFAFYARLSSSWIARAETANIDTLKDYQTNQLPAWQRSFERLGGTVSGSGVTPRETPEQWDPLGELARLLPWIVGGLAIVYLGPGLMKLAGRVKWK